MLGHRDRFTLAILSEYCSVLENKITLLVCFVWGIELYRNSIMVCEWKRKWLSIIIRFHVTFPAFVHEVRVRSPQI